jgi:hypothetical protein
MGIVLIASLGLAALSQATETSAGLVFLVTAVVLGLAVVGVVCRGKRERSWWFGFALFGWGYLKLAFFWNGCWRPQLVTMTLTDALLSKLGASPIPLSTSSPNSSFLDRVSPSWQVGHCLWSLLFAVLGGILAHALFESEAGRSALFVEEPAEPR